MKSVFFVLMVMVGLSIATPYSFAERGEHYNGRLKRGGIGDFNGNILFQEFRNDVSHIKKNSKLKKRASHDEMTPNKFFNIFNNNSNGQISAEEFNNRKRRKDRRD